MSGGSSFITFADESQQNSKANTFTDNSLISEDDTDVDDECDLQDTESNRLLRTNSESGPVFLYIQMELCKETLKDWLAHNSINREYVCVIKIFHEIVTAVEYVHAQEMMHRDLKVMTNACSRTAGLDIYSSLLPPICSLSISISPSSLSSLSCLSHLYSVMCAVV